MYPCPDRLIVVYWCGAEARERVWRHRKGFGGAGKSACDAGCRGSASCAGGAGDEAAGSTVHCDGGGAINGSVGVDGASDTGSVGDGGWCGRCGR